MLQNGTVINDVTNYCYSTLSGDGVFSAIDEDNTIFYPINKSKVDFVAYYPYRMNSGESYLVTNWNSTRQDTLDLLVAKATGHSQAYPEASLSFFHQFSKIVLKFSANNETGLTNEDLAGLSVSINGINKPASFNLLTKEVSYSNALNEAVSMKVSQDGRTAEAIVPSTSGTDAIITLADGSTYTWDISNYTFESGKCYPFSITLKAAPNYVEASLGSVINDWNTEESNEVNLDEDTKRPMSVKTLIIDGTSQPPLVGGEIENYCSDSIVRKGLICSKKNISGIESNPKYYSFIDGFSVYEYFLNRKEINLGSDPFETKVFDCTDFSEEQFSGRLKGLYGNTNYYVKAFAITTSNDTLYGEELMFTTQAMNRYNGRRDYANVYYYGKYTTFGLITDCNLDEEEGYYISSNENPTSCTYKKHSQSAGLMYRFLSKWTYKMWYNFGCEKTHKPLVLSPTMTYSNGKLSIASANEEDIYYSINGDFKHPENFENKYTEPISISDSCVVYCYAINSDGVFSFTNAYQVNP